MERLPGWSVGLGHAPQEGTAGDGGEVEPVLQSTDGAARGVAGAGENGELLDLAGLVGLRSADGDDEAVGVLGDAVGVQCGELAAAQGGDEADEEQDPVASTR